MQQLSRRRFLQASAMTVAGSALAACAAPTTPQSGTEGGEQAASDQVTITYLVRTDIGAKMNEWTEQAVEDFGEKYPNITVEQIGVPWGDYNAKLLTMFASGTPPEISANYAAGFPTFYANDAILPLDDFIAAQDADMSQIEQAAVDAVTREGQVWAMPLAHMPVLVFYNKQLFDEAGVEPPPAEAGAAAWTTDRMLENASAIARDIDDPTAAQWGMVFPPGQLGVYSWLWDMDPFNNEGGPELTEAYQTGIVTEAFYDRPEMVEYIQWLVDLTYDHGVAPRPTDTDAMEQTVGWPLMSGRIGMYVQGAWSFTDFANVQPEWEWGAAPMPIGPQGFTKPPLFNDSWMLSAGSAEPEAGFTFLKYLALEEGAQLYAEISGFFPANNQNYDVFFDSIMNIPNGALSRDELQQVLLGSFEYGYPTPGKTLDSYPEWNNAFNQTTAPIFNNEIGVAEGLQAVQTQFESIIATKL